jgi:hypothetical protein
MPGALAEGDAGRQREQKRSEAIQREYSAKLHDLTRQYAMRVAVEWVQTLELVMPVQRFAVRVRRRKAERVIHLDWNPLARRLETPPCEFRYSGDRPRIVCDDALHLVTAEGLSPCAYCGRVFCRACHRERCPKCQRPVAAAADTVAPIAVTMAQYPRMLRSAAASVPLLAWQY